MVAAIDDIDLVNPDSYVERVPHEWFDRLREGSPVVWHPEPAPNKGFWAVTRYDDLTKVHMDWQTFSSETGAVSLEELDPEQLHVAQEHAGDRPAPAHGAAPHLLVPLLGARAWGGSRTSSARSRSACWTARSPRESSISWARSPASCRSASCCSIFTVPQDDAPELIRWGDQMIANQDPDLSAAQVGRGRHRGLPAPAVPLPRRARGVELRGPASASSGWPSRPTT